MAMTPEVRARRIAMDKLARREQLASEIRQVLQQKGFDVEIIEQVLSDLRSENLQSDARYIEAFVQSKFSHGYGPNWIARALQQKGVDPEDSISVLSEISSDAWLERLSQLIAKKFGTDPANYPPRQKMQRYLYQRGFSWEQMVKVLA